MKLTRFDPAAFLRDNWQQAPLLIRDPWDDWRNPLEPDELAGLACEEGVEARIVMGFAGDRKAKQGPFKPARFGKLGKAPWTLLVQAVDHHVPEVAALIAPFRFVPDWRIDDVMVSYAVDGGGVGPHFDQYDVFLIQGQGRRRWRIGPVCDATTELLPHDDLRLLAHFEASEEWVLEPGDVLYVPPGYAHEGTAIGDDCMTYSIGFRAPARSELIAHWCDDLLATLSDHDRYTDRGLPIQGNPGEISPEAIAALHAMVTEKLTDRAAFARWFGQYGSQPKYPDIDWSPEGPVDEEDLQTLIAGGATLCRNPASRFAFVRQVEGSLLLFVDGRCFECTGQTAVFALELCREAECALDPQLAGSPTVLALIGELVNSGSAAFAD
jgi:50S ribosomal protein L16 3-hydroxylase